MTGHITPGRSLPGAQALSRISDGVVGPQPLRGGVEQVHAPGVGVSALRCDEQIAICRRRIDAGQHGCRTLEQLVVQADAYARQVLALVDDTRLPRCRLEHVVHAAEADSDA